MIDNENAVTISYKVAAIADVDLLVHFMQGCRRLEVGALHPEVERWNVNALALYRKVGFVDQERYLLTKMITAKR